MIDTPYGTFAKAAMMLGLVSQATHPTMKSQRSISCIRRGSKSLKKTDVFAVDVAARSMSCWYLHHRLRRK
jgi:hypothetical protein